MTTRRSRLSRCLLAALAAGALACGCTRARGPGLPAPGPAVSILRAPELRIVYPPAGATLTASDSTFVFGSVSPAGAPVTVNGVRARQAAGGGWLAYVPVEPGPFTFHVAAGRPAAGLAGPVQVEVPVTVPGGFEASWAGVIDTASVAPRDSLELAPGEPVRVRFKGVPGLRGRVVLGRHAAAAPFSEEAAPGWDVGRLVFGPAGASRDRAGTARQAIAGREWVWYAAELVVPEPPRRGATPPGADRGRRRGARPEPRRGAGARSREGAGDRGSAGDRGWLALWIEVARGEGASRYRLPAAAVLPRDPAARPVAVLDDDPQAEGGTDGRVVARTAADGVYFLFLPNGTRVRTGSRIGERRELLLAPGLSVWAERDELQPLPAGTPAPRSAVPVVRTRGMGEWTRIVVPLAERLPVQIRQDTRPARYEVTIFGASAATEFLRLDGGDDLVRELRWNQPANGRFVLEVELAQAQPWGYRYGYEGTDFHLDVRRAPRIRGGLFRSVLDGLKVVVDPGHSPDPGATGPTGLREKDANLAVALELSRQLERRGAEVVLTRDLATPPDSGPGLVHRTLLAARAEAHLLVSVHHNALPDGVNPFENHGTSTYYYHPQSLPLARAVQRELVDALGLPDLGIGLGNLALARPTEMPAVLTEAAFMMIPEQEELLRMEAFQRKQATAIRRGLERFLKEARASERG